MTSLTRSLVVGVTLLACFAVAVAAQDDDVDETDVIVGTTDVFEDLISENEHLFVEFYAPWCGHCKSLKPVYAAAATALLDTGVKFVKVDATEEEDIASKYGVRGYPTIFFFNNGRESKYEGPRTEDGFKNYATKFTGEAVTVLDDAKTLLDEWAIAKEPLVLFFFPSEEESELEKLSKVIESHRASNTFYVTYDAAVAAELGVEKIGIFLENEDSPRVYTEATFKTFSIRQFIRDNQIPLLAEVSGENYSKYAADSRNLGFLFVNTDDDNSEVFTAVKEVCDAASKYVVCVWVDTDKFATQSERYGIKKPAYPGFGIDGATQDDKFQFPSFGDEWTTDGLAQFAEDAASGSIESYFKSGPIIKGEVEDGVTIIVGKTFEDIVLDPSKDVFVEFYAPWCGHCKKLAPHWTDLSELFEDEEDIVIAKMDVTENDIPGVTSVSSFPTLILFPKGEKSLTSEGVSFGDDRELGPLEAFVIKEAKSLSPAYEPAVADADEL